MGSGSEAREAIANATAETVVNQSAERFKANSQREYDYLSTQIDLARGDLAQKNKAVDEFTIANRISGGDASLLAPSIQSTYQQLKDDRDAAQTNLSSLVQRQAAVRDSIDKPRFDATRLGDALTDDVPGRPLRYLFLLVGALVGALAGLLLTWFRSIREDEAEAEANQTASAPGGTNGYGTGTPNGHPPAATGRESVIDVRSHGVPPTFGVPRVPVPPGPVVNGGAPQGPYGPIDQTVGGDGTGSA
ncbi:MAG: hypothetical protein R2698_12040 [Microthrixaceae bacterium]